MRSILSVVLAVALSASVATAAALTQSPNTGRRPQGPPIPTSDIVDTAVAANLETLVAAVRAAGLVDTLKGSGPFTVFAPTELAFAELPEGTLQSLLLPENRDRLRDVLSHHVVPGRLLSYEIANITEPQLARTAKGDRESIAADSRGFRFGEAKVVRADIACANGVIHVIDRVVVPRVSRTDERMKLAMKERTPASLLDALREVPDGRFSTFLAAVAAAGADQDWAKPSPDGNWTVFVPTNAAFDRLTTAERTALFAPANRASLRTLIDWHAIPEIQAWSFDDDDGDRGPTMISREKGRFVLDVLANGMVFVYTLRRSRNDEESFRAQVLVGDVEIGGCVVHVIDRVLVPPELENTTIASQSYRESEVKDLAAGAFAAFRACWVLKDTLAQADSLDDDAAIAVYELGLRITEDVVPVIRSGVLVMPETGRSRRESMRNRLKARIDELDRVWYAKFKKNSPKTGTLAALGPVGAVGAPSTDTVAIAPPTPVAPEAPSQPTPITPKAPKKPSSLDWADVLEKAPDPAVVTDAALREAIVKTGLPWRVRDRGTGIEMLLVPPGRFSMGRGKDDADAWANELPAHDVTLTEAFYLGRREVTRKEWNALSAGAAAESRGRSSPAGGAITLRSLEGVEIEAREVERDGGVVTVEVASPGTQGVRVRAGAQFRDASGKPVEADVIAETGPNGELSITSTPVDARGEREAAEAGPDTPATAGWTACAGWSRRAGLRLPTEAEWEFACRAGTTAPRYGALDDVAWHKGNSNGPRNPVGKKAANPLGFHDMLGNAWEWVEDWYADYTRAPKTDPRGPAKGTSRIARGGWFNFEHAKWCRASVRYELNAPDFATSIGFRVARDP